MISIAIDGPAGAGKSTIAKMIAKNIGFIYVDTGAMYRVIAYYCISNNININNTYEIIKSIKNLKINLEFNNNDQILLLNGNNISDKIRTPEISMLASNISAIAEIRDFLLSLQKNIAKKNNVIMDGRDIGTVVLPNANLKIFLTASLEERSKRRYYDLIKCNSSFTLESVIKDIKKRDFNDSNRDIAPLKPSKDSIIINTTGESIEQSVNKILIIIKEKICL